MKLATMTLQRNAVDDLTAKNAKLGTIQKQIASNNRIQKLSDDPVGAAKVNELTREVARYGQFESNMDYAEMRLGAEDEAFRSMTDVLQSVREEAVRAVTGTLNTSDRAAISDQFKLAAEQLVGMMNQKGSDGEYIFGGYQSSAAPFALNTATTPDSVVYNGDSYQRTVKIADGVTVAIGHPGYDAAGTSLFGAGDMNQDNIAGILNQFAADLADDSQSGSAILGQIDQVLEKLSNAQAQSGARLNLIESQREIAGDYKLFLEEQLGNVKDVDIIEAITQLNQEMTALQALQQSYVKTNSLSLFNYI